MHTIQYVAVCVFSAVSIAAIVLAVLRTRATERELEQTVTVTLTADTSQFEEAMRKMARSVDQMKVGMGTVMMPTMRRMVVLAGEFSVAMDRMMSGLPRWAWDDKLREVHVAGLEAKMYVRAGLDHEVSTPAALDALIAGISHLPHLTYEERAQVMAAAYRGWVNHRPLKQGGGLAFVATTGPAPLVLDVFPR
jgi:hypothetical protein